MVILNLTKLERHSQDEENVLASDGIIHSLLDVMHADAPYTVIQRAAHIHPTVTELIPTMPGDLNVFE